MAQRTRKAAGPDAAADLKHETDRSTKAGRGKNVPPTNPQAVSREEVTEGKEDAARKIIREEFNDREDLSERQLNNRNWL